MKGIPGDEIARRARSGPAEREALFRELWNEYWSRLASFLSSFGLGDEDGEDAAQDALIKAFERMLHYDPSRAFSTWLFAIGRNVALDRMRSARRREGGAREAAREAAAHAAAGPEPSAVRPSPPTGRPPVELAPSPYPGPEEALLDEADAQFARRFVAGLDPRDRAIAELFYGQDLSCVEVGRSVGAPSGTVKWRLSEIRRRLAAAWEAENG
jgi:RNA polymerase sigma-70 factor, ECF subfamily